MVSTGWLPRAPQSVKEGGREGGREEGRKEGLERCGCSSRAPQSVKEGGREGRFEGGRKGERKGKKSVVALQGRLSL